MEVNQFLKDCHQSGLTHRFNDVYIVFVLRQTM